MKKVIEMTMNAAEEKPDKYWKRFKWFILAVDSIILILLGIAMRSIIKSDSSGWGAAILLIVLFIFFIFFLFIWSRIVGPEIAGYIGRKLAGNIMYPGNLTREAPPEMAKIRSMIANGDIGNAVEELKSILREKPRDRYAVELLSDILIDKTKDYKIALGLLLDYFKKQQREDDDFQFVMKTVDVYLEINAADRAVAFLNTELEKKYSSKVLEKIKKRLEGISGDQVL